MIPWIVGGLAVASVAWFFKIHNQPAGTPMTPQSDARFKVGDIVLISGLSDNHDFGFAVGSLGSITKITITKTAGTPFFYDVDTNKGHAINVPQDQLTLKAG